MSEKKAVTHTESEEKSAIKVQQTIKFHIEEFEALMKSYKTGEEGRLESEGVSSELAPRAVWKLRVYPNGHTEQYKGNITVVIWLTGPMKHNGESLDATYHLYLVDGSGSNKIDVLERHTDNFKKEHYSGGWVGHEKVKKALYADGSLLVVADVDFLAPYNGKVEEICKECAPSGDETRKTPGVKSSEPYDDSGHDPSDWTIEIEKRSIGKALNVGNVIAMAVLADSNSLDTCSAELLNEACLQLIASEWDAVFESVKWKRLEEERPELAADLALGAATLIDMDSAEKFKEACLKLIASGGKAVYETAAWKVLRETKPQFALDLAEKK